MVTTFMKKHKQAISTIVLIALSGFLAYFKVQSGGYGNLYYAAAVKSMMLSPHNFFFASFDPGGFVSVDKPPVALWIQTIFAFVFGFHGWSILLPEAIAAVLSVLLINRLVGRTFGFWAGIIAALTLALSPIFVAVSRTNNLDSILVLDLLLSAWAFLKAIERENVKLLMLAMSLVGIGFNIKMMEAYLVLPAFILTYLIFSNATLRKKLIRMAAAVAILLVVSFSWAVAVDLTPAADRPYVGSSGSNSVVELAFGYNGIHRILSGLKWVKSLQAMLNGQSQPKNLQVIQSNLTLVQASPSVSTDYPGIFRLFGKNLGGQAGWFLVIALLGLPAFLLWNHNNHTGVSREQRIGAVFWSSLVYIMFAFFSCVNITHRYYLLVMTPALAAMTAIGLTSMWKLYRSGRISGYLLPAALALNSFTQSFLIMGNGAWSGCLARAVINAGLYMVAMLILLRIFVNHRKEPSGHASLFVVFAIVLLFAAPAVWSASPIIFGERAEDPVAVPHSFINTSVAQPNHVKQVAYENSMIGYMVKHNKGSKYLSAVQNAADAESMILRTGMPVMSIGGYSGNDPILSLNNFEKIMQKGTVSFFLVDTTFHCKGQWAVIDWVRQNMRRVTPEEITGKNMDHIGSGRYVLYSMDKSKTAVKPEGLREKII